MLIISTRTIFVSWIIINKVRWKWNELSYNHAKDWKNRMRILGRLWWQIGNTSHYFHCIISINMFLSIAVSYRYSTLKMWFNNKLYYLCIHCMCPQQGWVQVLNYQYIQKYLSTSTSSFITNSNFIIFYVKFR